MLRTKMKRKETELHPHESTKEAVLHMVTGFGPELSCPDDVRVVHDGVEPSTKCSCLRFFAQLRRAN